ncbi:MAG TPA: hypothetical protein VGI66_08500 [Streptosporangiaceae bacterium]
MIVSADAARVRRLLRWYPASWRARYGEEFTELLLADFAERPRSGRRTTDVIGSGLLARCTCAGLTSHRLPTAEQGPAGLATLGCALAAFAAFGMAMLAQLATGWQWASPGSPAAATGVAVMVVAAVCFGLIGLAAIIPLGWQAAVAARGDRRLARPAGLAVASAAVLIIGTHYLQNGWPGTGGTHHGLMPSGMAAFGWASTLSVSSYWVHPALLARFPMPELAWMAASPAAWIGLLTGLVVVTRRLSWPQRLLRYQATLAVAATAVAIAFMAGAASWVLGRGQTGMFRPGLVDSAELAIMAIALVVALRAAAAVRHAGLRRAGRQS